MVLPRTKTFKYKCLICKQEGLGPFNSKVHPGRCRKLYEQRLKHSAEPPARLLIRLVYTDGLVKYGHIPNSLLSWDAAVLTFIPRQHHIEERVAFSELQSLTVVRPIKGGA